MCRVVGLFFFPKGVGNKAEISVKGQEKLNSSASQRNEKATCNVQNASSSETTSGSAGRRSAGALNFNSLAFNSHVKTDIFLLDKNDFERLSIYVIALPNVIHEEPRCLRNTGCLSDALELLKPLNFQHLQLAVSKSNY